MFIAYLDLQSLTFCLISYTNDYSQAKNALAYIFFSDGIPIVYAGQEQHYNGGDDPYNQEATWLSGYSTTAELYQFIATTNNLRKVVISRDPSYLTTRVLFVLWVKIS